MAKDLADVQVIPIGENMQGLAVTLTKEAIRQIRAGKTYPVDLIFGDHKVTLMVMRDSTFKEKWEKIQAKLKARLVKQQVEQEDLAAQQEAADLGEALASDSVAETPAT